MSDTGPARRVTRDVDPAAVRDLLDHPPRATVAFVDGGAAQLLPARFRYAEVKGGAGYLHFVPTEAEILRRP